MPAPAPLPGFALLCALIASCAREPTTAELVATLLESGPRATSGRDRRFFDAFDALARAQGWDAAEARFYDSGAGAVHGRASGPLDRGSAKRLVDRIVVVLACRRVSVPGVSATKLLLLDGDGRLLDAIACGMDSRHGDPAPEVLDVPDVDGASIVVRFVPRGRDLWHSWHVVTYAGRAYTFREDERKPVGDWDRKGLLRLGIREGKFDVKFPDLAHAVR